MENLTDLPVKKLLQMIDEIETEITQFDSDENEFGSQQGGDYIRGDMQERKDELIQAVRDKTTAFLVNMRGDDLYYIARFVELLDEGGYNVD